MAAKKICFFVTPIGHANSQERKRADNIQKYILNAVLASKFKILRADELPQPGSISHQVIKWLFDADLVIADLTGLNPNVVYELAIRHAFNKVSIHLIDKAESIPFDLKDERTITVDLSDPAAVDECKQSLTRNVKEIGRTGFVYSSPIFRVLGVAAATPEDREDFLETMADKVENIASDVGSMYTEISFVDFNEIETNVQRLSKDAEELKNSVQEILNRLSALTRGDRDDNSSP